MNWRKSLTILTVLVNSVGRFVKIAQQQQQQKATILRSHYRTESKTLFSLLLYHVDAHKMGDQAVSAIHAKYTPYPIPHSLHFP